MTRLAVLAAGVLLLGCQRSQPAPPVAVERTADVAELRAAGDARRSRGDFAGALAAYRTGLQKAPDDLRLRYLTGVTLTELDRRDEAAVELRWVIDHGRPDREEVSLARQWLASSGQGRQAARVSSSPAAPPAATADPVWGGRLQGKTEWKSLDPQRPVPRLQLVLVGEDRATKGRRYATMLLMNEPYQFSGVQPGEYRLVGQVGMKRLWDLRVVVQQGKPTVLDLTDGTAIAGPETLKARSS